MDTQLTHRPCHCDEEQGLVHLLPSPGCLLVSLPHFLDLLFAQPVSFLLGSSGPVVDDFLFEPHFLPKGTRLVYTLSRHTGLVFVVPSPTLVV